MKINAKSINLTKIQKEAEESFPAAFVGKCGQFQKTAPKMRLVCWIFHKYHPIVFVG